MLQVNDLSIRYGKRLIIDNFSIEVNKGELVALLGISGVGKSSILTCINGLCSLNDNCEAQGEIRVDGVSVSTVDLSKRCEYIGMLFQTPNPLPFSVLKNFSIPLSQKGLSKKEILEKALANLERVKLLNEVPNILEINALDLSGGQQQRLCLARCLSLNPQILLLDEPTSSLDPASTKVIESLFCELKKEKPMLMVTHSLQQTKRLADRFCFITDNYSSSEGVVSDTNINDLAVKYF